VSIKKDKFFMNSVIGIDRFELGRVKLQKYLKVMGSSGYRILRRDYLIVDFNGFFSQQ
jgi:hypothetical protein